MSTRLWRAFGFSLPAALLLSLGSVALEGGPPPAAPPYDVVTPPSQGRPLPAEPLPAPLPGTNPATGDQSQGPALEGPSPPPTDQPLPINLATALYLSNARPLIIAFAQNSVEEAAALLQGANVLWLPNFNVGADYYRHDGTDQTTPGPVIVDSKSSLMAGGGFTLDFGVTDAIFRPLAARQILYARQWGVQAASNDALALVAEAYFNVQEARGRLAGNVESQAKGRELERRIKGLSQGFIPEIEVNRARALLLELQQEAETTTAAWRTSSARLTRLLRLNPGAVVVPLEPPHLQVTLVRPGQPVDDLIPVGLTNRPELASQQALVRSTLELLRQERIRPLIPSLVLRGRQGPGGALEGGVFGGGPNDQMDMWGGRFDADISAVWTLYNLGAGNRTLVRTRAAQEQRAMLDLCNLQDRVAEEVVQAHAQVEAAVAQIAEAANQVKEAIITFNGTLTGIGQTRGAGELLQLVNRPQEAVAALQQLNRSYTNYFSAVNGYNRAQFQLYRAIGYPAQNVACDPPVGEVQPVETSRPSMGP